MSRSRADGAATAGPVLAGVLDVTTAEDVLALAFDEAQRRAVPLRVVPAGLPAADEAVLLELIERWSGKHPDVPIMTMTSGPLDPAIILTAATRGCCLAVLTAPADARLAAALHAAQRRAACPLVVVRAGSAAQLPASSVCDDPNPG